jgi:hypothetical protein
MEQVRFEKQMITQVANDFPAFVKFECSLPCSQEPATGYTLGGMNLVTPSHIIYIKTS